MTLGEQRKAELIPMARAMQLFEDEDSIRWAIEVHAKNAHTYGITTDNCDGIIIAGNEDAPIYVWGTRPVDRKDGLPANHLKATYTLLHFDEEQSPELKGK